MIVNLGDFTGKYELHTGIYDASKLQSYIDKYEPYYLRELFGVTLYNEFMSDLILVNNQYVPQSPNFLLLFNELHEDVNVYRQLNSDGIKEMLIGFIYFEYLKDSMNMMTPFGNTIPRSELSKQTTTLNTLMYNRYNTAIKSFTAIRDYIFLNWNDFPTGQIVALTQLQNAPLYSGGTKFLTIAQNWATGATIDMQGSGYGAGEECFVGNTGMQIEIYQIGGSGEILDFGIIQGGYNYQIGSIYPVLSGNGSGGQLLITQVGNSVGTFTGNASVQIQAQPIGGLASLTIVNQGGGYYDEDNVNVWGGSGFGGLVDIIADPTSTGLVGVTPSNVQGYGYVQGDYLNVDQNGNVSGQVLVSGVTNGWINSLTMNPNVTQNSQNFQVGDRVRVIGSGQSRDAIYEVTEVGIGDITSYNGKEKLMAYWI